MCELSLLSGDVARRGIWPVCAANVSSSTCGQAIEHHAVAQSHEACRTLRQVLVVPLSELHSFPALSRSHSIIYITQPGLEHPHIRHRIVFPVVKLSPG
jgi:hypothetical protein